MSIFHGENGLFGQPKVQEAYNIINFWFLMENSILKIFGSMDVKITPDFCSYTYWHYQKRTTVTWKCQPFFRDWRKKNVGTDFIKNRKKHIRNWHKVKTWLDQMFWQIYQKLILTGFLRSGNLCLIHHLKLFWPHTNE